ncbi:MAG: hypothetical protein MZU97_19120 [Bacillus subtilis]|nr:hypothetical protein [Bacillus subtilis]
MDRDAVECVLVRYSRRRIRDDSSRLDIQRQCHVPASCCAGDTARRVGRLQSRIRRTPFYLPVN